MMDKDISPNASANVTVFGNSTNVGNYVPAIFMVWEVVDKLLVVLANGFTLTIIYRHRYEMLEISSNIFIGCLTLADMVSVLVLPFNFASVYLENGVVWNITCFASLWMAAATSFINTVILCVISLDRLIYIICPLQYQNKMPVTRAWIISVCVFMGSFLYSLGGVLIGYTDASSLGSIARPCHGSFSMQGLSRQLMFYPYIIFIPITIGSYIKVGLVAWKQKRSITGQITAGPPVNNNKITKVMLTVISAYIVCNVVVMFTPILLNLLQDNTREIAFRVSVFIWRVNTWLNPFIYSWKSKKFRRYLTRIIRRHQVSVTEIYTVELNSTK